MRLAALIGTIAAGVIAATMFAGPASADRVCRQVCDEGFCRSHCWERDSGYYYDRDRDYYRYHHRPGIEFHVPGGDVEIGR